MESFSLIQCFAFFLFLWVNGDTVHPSRLLFMSYHRVPKYLNNESIQFVFFDTLGRTGLKSLGMGLKSWLRLAFTAFPVAHTKHYCSIDCPQSLQTQIYHCSGHCLTYYNSLSSESGFGFGVLLLLCPFASLDHNLNVICSSILFFHGILSGCKHKCVHSTLKHKHTA